MHCKSPLISIIVPVYKAESTLNKCADSLLNQTYSNIEVVLVDDGSPDNSPSICDEITKLDNRVKTIHIPNGGVSNARNIGMQNAVGDYLCFVDSDDYVDANYIQNFVDGLTESADLVFQGINEVKDNGDIIKKVPDYGIYCEDNVLEGISDINKYSMFGYVCNKLYRRSIIKEHNITFRTDINISEDRIFALQYMAYVKEMRTINKSAYFYIMQTTGLTLRQRSYEEIKTAADENLRVAKELLKNRCSDRFSRDTKRMYIMSATGYLIALFKLKYSYMQRYRAIDQFQKEYVQWLSLYTPVSTDQKVLYELLKHSPSICVIFMQVYFAFKNIRHGKFA